MNLAIFLEEPSAKEMLRGVLPRLLPDDVDVRYVVFSGKQDLERQLSRKIRSWRKPNTRFLVLRDQDSSDCKIVKDDLKRKCREAGRPDVLVRVACHELESFYLGDLGAVEIGLGCAGLSRKSSKARYRRPDEIARPSEELRLITHRLYQKVAGSRAIGPHLSLTENRSSSFLALIRGIEKLLLFM